ncbi:MAG: formate--tetrahydrofolate ligase [Myxococcota bacterium]
MPATELDDIAARLEIPDVAIDPRGRQVLKIDPAAIQGNRGGRVVLVTAMTPTPAGDGKTTTSLGLVDGLAKRGVRAIGALREPSLGPLFGLKGGAIGGGRARVVPSEQINLHFTGDIHAVTSAHNLLSAILDNHLFFDGKPQLDVDNVTWGRVLDMNDRALRSCQVGFATKKGPVRTERFDITAASEVMAILCMSRDIEDLRARLDRIVVGTTADGRPVTAKDLGAGGAMATILLDAARPNLVRTLEGNPVLVHGGPFANIAQGTSTLIQTQLARRLADVVVTEAGFAFDLGGFKFLDIKCRAGGFKPAAVVLVTTIRALRYHGGADYSAGPNLAAVERGLENVGAHMDAMSRLGLPAPLISINRFPDDSEEELAALQRYVEGKGGSAVAGEYFARGGDGATALADALLARLAAESDDSPQYRSPYDLDDTVPEKLEAVARVVLGATGVELSERARADLAVIERMGLAQGVPVCLAKTHLSISDDKSVQGRPPPFVLQVTGLRPAAGAGFVVALCGPILTMPGLPERPAAWDVDIAQDARGKYVIEGLR